MKNKVLLTMLFAAILCVILVIPTYAAEDSVVGVPEYTTIGSEEYFFANGAAITVEARTDGQDGALVKWTENGVEKSQVLGDVKGATKTNIFGGMHNNDTAVTTSITINGGYVQWIHGGGLHRSNTTTSNIVMNGGQVAQLNGGGADGWVPTACGCSAEDRLWIDGDYENAPCQTGTANITIKDGKIERLDGVKGNVFGGGTRYANTEKVNITISGGNLSNTLVTGGGSNGYTEEAIVTITGGTVGTVQGIVRGTMKNTGIVVTGGTVDTVWVGAQEASDSTGTVTGEVAVGVAGEGKVTTLSLGLNGTQSIEDTTVYNSDYILVQNGTVKNAEDLADKVAILYNVQIDDDLYLIQEGYTIEDLENYNDIITKEGYTFKGFTIAENAYWDPKTPVTEDMHLTTEFEKIETPVVEDNTGDNIEDKVEDKVEDNAQDNNEDKIDETPKMGVESTMLTVFAVVAVISLAGIALIKKANRR